MPSFLEEFVKQSFAGERTPLRSMAEILAPFRAEIERSGVTDGDLDAVFTEGRARFANRRQTRQ